MLRKCNLEISDGALSGVSKVYTSVTFISEKFATPGYKK